jgi:penicillin-binding protein 1A
VWVGRDDNASLGKITGGTAPADIWRRFMGPAVAIDGRRGPPLPSTFRIPERRPATPPAERKSPLPEEWSDGGEALREIIDMVEQIANEI